MWPLLLDHYSTKAHAIIYGGGAIVSKYRQDNFFDSDEANFKIAWGVGYSRSGMKNPGEVIIANNFDLYGRREFGR